MLPPQHPAYNVICDPLGFVKYPHLGRMQFAGFLLTSLRLVNAQLGTLKTSSRYDTNLGDLQSKHLTRITSVRFQLSRGCSLQNMTMSYGYSSFGSLSGMHSQRHDSILTNPSVFLKKLPDNSVRNLGSFKILHAPPSKPWSYPPRQRHAGGGKEGKLNTSDSRGRNPSGARPKLFNLNTYKLHALGDYVHTIHMFGTTDSYTTQIVSQSQLLSP